MAELLLLRHAKSSWSTPGLADSERPLNGRGRRAASLVGRHLAAAGLLPDRILCSTARRTRETLALLLAAWPETPPQLLLPQLYEASPERILAAVRAEGDGARRLLVIGHNPGLERLAISLAGRPDDAAGAAALAAMKDKYPTAALASFEVAAPWATLEKAATAPSRLLGFLTPGALAEEERAKNLSA